VRILAEPDLAGGSGDARWCVPADRRAGNGFVRFADGSAFAVAMRVFARTMAARSVAATCSPTVRR